MQSQIANRQLGTHHPATSTTNPSSRQSPSTAGTTPAPHKTNFPHSPSLVAPLPPLRTLPNRDCSTTDRPPIGPKPSQAKNREAHPNDRLRPTSHSPSSSTSRSPSSVVPLPPLRSAPDLNQQIEQALTRPPTSLPPIHPSSPSRVSESPIPTTKSPKGPTLPHVERAGSSPVAPFAPPPSSPACTSQPIRSPPNPNKPADWASMSHRQRDKWNKHNRLLPEAPIEPDPTHDPVAKPADWQSMTSKQKSNWLKRHPGGL